MATSLWTRRRLSLRGAVVNPSSPPRPPIALVIMDSNTACPSLSIQAASSPSVSPRTPTIFSSMLLDEPQDLSARCLEAAAAITSWSDAATIADTSAFSTRHPTSPVDANHALDGKSPTLTAAQSRAELRIEIDLAALATEMALSLFTSDSEDSSEDFASDIGGHNPAWKQESRRMPRRRLLPDTMQIVDDDEDGDVGAAQRLTRDRNSERMPSLSSGTTLTETSSYRSFSPSTPFDRSISEHSSLADGEHTGSRSSFSPRDSMDIDGNEEEKPMRKGRARMSQEKRRRLARRREREAMLLGLPPRSASAPAHQTSFVGYQALRQASGRVSMQADDSIHGTAAYGRSESTPQLSVVDYSHVEVAPTRPPPRSVTHDHLFPPSETAAGMSRSASTPNALQYSGGNSQWRGSTRDSKQRPLLHHHHQHQQQHPTRPVFLSGAKPTIIARSPVFGSWPSLSDAQSASSWRSRASDGSGLSP